MKRCSLLLAVLLLIGSAAFTACNREEGLEIDTSKTQLYVSNYTGGYGNEWLTSAVDRFQQKYAETEFEAGSGKKGVQVVVLDGKETGTVVFNTMRASSAEVFFTEGVYASDFVNAGLVADITDIVTEDLTMYGESGSIEDKLTDAQKDYFGMVENGQTHYYMVPHYQSFRGLVYDVDLFDEEKLFIAKNGAPSETLQTGGTFSGTYVFTNEAGDRSAGPDKLYGTSDDGLPATYEEFYALADKMGSKGITPVSYAGSVQVYYDDFLTALEADDAGLNDMMANYTFSGTVDSIVDISTVKSDGTYQLADPVEMNNRNGYLMARLEGKYNALKFTERLVTGGKYGPYFSTDCFSSVSHIENQNNFLYGRFGGDKHIGMIVEGCFWENEADPTFRSMANRYGAEAGRYERRFAIMPYPKATLDKVGEPLTLVDSLMSAGFIKAGLAEEKTELAKLFLQFLNTDESLREFNVLTGAPKSLEYELTDADKDQLSYFGNSLIELRNAENVDIVYPCSSNSIYRSNPANFFSSTEWNGISEGVPYSDPQKLMNDKGKSAYDMFLGISNRVTQASWNNSYSNFF